MGARTISEREWRDLAAQVDDLLRISAAERERARTLRSELGVDTRPGEDSREESLSAARIAPRPRPGLSPPATPPRRQPRAARPTARPPRAAPPPCRSSPT